MNENATIEDRTLAQAMQVAEQREFDLQRVAQVVPSDWDTVILAHEINRLRSELEKAKAWESVAKRFHDTATEENP